MNDIERRITALLERAGSDPTLDIPEELIEECGERVKKALRKAFKEQQETAFRLRMSNVGRPLRTLLLEKRYGRPTLSPVVKIRMLYGYLAESLMVFLLKASGCEVEELDKEVTYEYNGHKLDGTFDIKIDGLIYDIKSASAYSYNNKFRDLMTLIKSDSFGYLAQGFGYGAADKAKFGGWIVMDKSNGDYKVLSIPGAVYRELETQFMTEIHSKMDYIYSGKEEIPDCPNVKKVRGKITYGGDCRFCDFKDKCHPKEEE